MALQTITFAGFESSHDYEVVVAAGTVSILTTPAPAQANESYTMNLVGGGVDAIVELPSNFNFTSNRFITMGMYIQFQTAAPAGETPFLEIEGTGKINLSLAYLSDGSIQVRDSNNNIAATTAVGTIVAGTWYLLEFEWKADTAANGGALQLFLDSTSILTLTSQDFEKNGQTASKVRFLGSRAGESLYISSFYFLIDGTAYPTRYGPYEALVYAYSEATATPNVFGDDLEISTLWSQSAEKTGNDANFSRYTTDGNKGIVQTDFTGGGYTAGPRNDSRVGTVVVASWLFRLAASGINPLYKVYYGAEVGPTDGTIASSTGLPAAVIFYDDGTLMPTKDEYFQYGLELISGFTADLKEVWCTILHQPSSGTALVRVVDETVNISDGTVSQRGLVKQVASTVNLSDASLRPMVKVRQVADTVQLADAQVAAAALVREVTETVNLPDGQVPARARLGIVGETVNVGDATLILISSALVQVVGETVGLSDGTVNAKQIAKVVGESVNLTEQIESPRRIVQSVASTLQIADAVSRRGSSIRSTGSTVAIADGQAAGLALVRVVADVVDVSESTPWVRGLSRETGDTVNLADGTIRAVASAIVKVSGSTVNVSEGTLRPVSSALLQIVNDSVSIAEAVTRRGSLVRAAASTVDITDATNTAIGLVRLSAASINLAEQVNNHLAMVRLTAAGINVGETTIATRGVVKIVSDAVNVSDGNLHLVASAGNALLQIVADTLSLTEAVERHKAIAQTIGESVNITDATNKAAAFVRSVSDPINVSESVDRLGSIVRAVDATLSMTESVNRLRGITKLFGSTLNLSGQVNTRRGIVRVTGSTLALADAIARAAALVRLIDEAVTVADAQLAARALRRIASEGVNIGEGLIFSGVFPFVTVNESVSLSEGVLHRLTERGHVDLEDLMADLHRTATIESDLDVEAVMQDIFSGLKM